MGLLERVNAQVAVARRRDSSGDPLSIDDWAAYFTFGGLAYPLIQTTMGGVDKERIPVTSIIAHETNVAVFSLVLARVQAFSQIAFQWTRFVGSQAGDLWGTPELKVLEKPWPGGHTAGLLARMEIDNCIAGNAYIVRPRKNRLARLRPDRVTIVLGSQTDAEEPSDAPDIEVAGYFYMPRSGRGRTFFPDEICHYAPMPDPVYQFLGMSWMTPAIREIQADTLATEHKARYFENAATPNLAIKFDPNVPIEHVRQFKALLEEDHAGAWNAYKTLYLGGGADPVPVGSNFQQLDFANTQGKGESRLAAAAGVPPSWVGFSEGLQGSSLNAGNFQSARRRFSDGTMWWLWMNAAGSLENVLNRPPGARLWFDPNVPFMRDDATDIAAIQEQQARVINMLVMQGFEPDSVVQSIVHNDFKRLKHTGMLSVQLQPPGQAPPGESASGSNGNGNGTVSSNNGTSSSGDGNSNGKVRGPNGTPSLYGA
jgi:hypothetical protein